MLLLLSSNRDVFSHWLLDYKKKIKAAEFLRGFCCFTSEWTPEEIIELLENGKVEGYEGHHINNVADHPDMADDPDNIEFVTKDEHRYDRHGGNTRNPTSGKRIDRSERLKEAKGG